MSTSNNKKKKVVVTGSKKTVGTKTVKKKKVAPTVARRNRASAVKSEPMVFGRENFKWMLIGLAVIVLGLALMSGGSMPSPDVWDESLIYSHRRITLAPLVLLIGLGIEIYAIFK